MIGFERDTLAIVLAGLAVLAAAVMAHELAQGRRRRIAQRLAQACAPSAAAGRGRVRQSLGSRLAPVLRPAMAALFSRETDRRDMTRLMAAAGLGGDGALMKLAAAKAVGAAALALAGYVAAAAVAGDNVFLRLALIMGAGVAGAIAPEVALRRLARARRDRLKEALPDAIDLMVISANAGQSLDMAIDRVAKELQGFAPELAAELQTAAAEMQALPDRVDALRNFAERTDLPEVRAFCMTLAQSVKYGSPFSEALRALGADLRAARMLAAEERGARLPAMLTLPLILFIMPAVFVVVIGPAAVSMGDLFGN
jgi:tight adherence protein C